MMNPVLVARTTREDIVYTTLDDYFNLIRTVINRYSNGGPAECFLDSSMLIQPPVYFYDHVRGMYDSGKSKVLFDNLRQAMKSGRDIGKIVGELIDFEHSFYSAMTLLLRQGELRIPKTVYDELGDAVCYNKKTIGRIRKRSASHGDSLRSRKGEKKLTDQVGRIYDRRAAALRKIMGVAEKKKSELESRLEQHWNFYNEMDSFFLKCWEQPNGVEKEEKEEAQGSKGIEDTTPQNNETEEHLDYRIVAEIVSYAHLRGTDARVLTANTEHFEKLFRNAGRNPDYFRSKRLKELNAQVRVELYTKKDFTENTQNREFVTDLFLARDLVFHWQMLLSRYFNISVRTGKA